MDLLRSLTVEKPGKVRRVTHDASVSCQMNRCISRCDEQIRCTGLNEEYGSLVYRTETASSEDDSSLGRRSGKGSGKCM